MLRNAFLMMGLIALTTVSSASAAVVGFRGVLTANPVSGGSLSLPLNTPFFGGITTGAPLGSTAFISGGFFNFNGTIITVSGGTVSIPSPNNLQFLVLAPNNVTALFTFTGVAGLGSTVNQAAFDALYPPIYTTTFQIFQTDGGSTVLASYDGSISSVPEPNSMIALAGLVFGAGAWRLRKRKPQAKA